MKTVTKYYIVLILGLTLLAGISSISSAEQNLIFIGGKANFADEWPYILYETDSTVSLGVHDQRPYIVDGEKPPAYVGSVRAKVGNPWNVITSNNKPLSNDIATAIDKGFRRVGTKLNVIEIPVSDDYHDALARLKKLESKRIVFITLREWRIDIYSRQGFFIDVTLQVFDSEGNELAKSNISHKDVGNSDGTVESIYQASRSYLSMLLNNPKVKSVLGSRDSIFEAIGKDPANRFVSYDNGTILDQVTGLMWAAKDNGSGTSWKGAKEYCENYRGGGYSDWRMPTQSELEMLYESRLDGMNVCNPTKYFKLTKCSMWSYEEHCYFRFDGGLRESTMRSVNFLPGILNASYRVLPVRSAK